MEGEQNIEGGAEGTWEEVAFLSILFCISLIFESVPVFYIFVKLNQERWKGESKTESKLKQLYFKLIL